MREIMLSIVVAFSLTAHLAMAAAPNYGYGSYGGFSEGTHLVGRDGLCLEMFPWLYKGTNYFPTRLSPCDEHKKQTQLWTIVDDGTIRPMNDRYCLVSYLPFGATTTNVIVRECEKESNPNKIWKHKKDGTIVHDGSGMVLTGKSNDYVTIEKNENTPSQSWVPTESLSPMVANIKYSLDNWCLQSTEDSNYVGLEGCNRENNNQRWALYGDGTIRQNVNTNYCLASSYKEDIGHYVVVSKCQDIPQQRWDLNTDSTINHPAYPEMAMDVFSIPLKGIIPQAVIIMSHRDGSPRQRWAIY